MSEINDKQYLILSLNFPTTSRVCVITLWIYENFVCVQSLISGITQNLEWSLDNDLRAEIKWQNGVAQGVITIR